MNSASPDPKPQGEPSQYPQDKLGPLYERALGLIEQQFQIFWLVFGAFLLAETVLVGSLASLVKDGPPQLVVAGAFLGIVLAFPWWTSFSYNHSLYKLRIEQAKEFEPGEGRFLTEGKSLIDGNEVRGVKMSWNAKTLKPRHSVAVLIWGFAVVLMALVWISTQNLSERQNQSSSFSVPMTLSPVDVARMLGVSEADVISTLEKGEFKGKKIGLTWRVTSTALDEFLK